MTITNISSRVNKPEIELPTADFLNAIFLNLHNQPQRGEYVAVCPDRHKTKISAELSNGKLTLCTYFCVSSINGEMVEKKNPDGETYHVLGRRRENLIHAYCFVCDDIGTKSKQLPIEPHWKMESSPGNEQWGYFIEPVAFSETGALEHYEACMVALSQAGYSDAGAGGSYRIMRLPHSKKTHDGPAARLVHWAPDLPRYSLDDVMEELDLEPVYQKRFRPSDTPLDKIPFPEFVQKYLTHINSSSSFSKVQDILRLLLKLSPDISYTDWVRVGMALKTLKNQSFAYQVFHCWSAQGKSYDPTEWPSKWHSFINNTEPRVELNTIFYIGQENGVGIKAREWPTQNELFRELNERCGVVAVGGGIKVVMQPSPIEQVMMGKNQIEPTWFSLDAFFTYFATLRTRGGEENAEPEGNVPQRWVKSPYRTTYAGIQMMPPPEEPEPNLFNLWRGFAIDPTEGDVSVFEEHIRKVLGAETEACGEYLVRFFAWCVQNPGRVAGVMVVLQGERGTGKSMVSDTIRRLFGLHGVIIDHDDGVTGKFNKELENALFVSLEEAGWAGDKKGQAKLKNLITASQMRVEPKGVDPYIVRSGVKAVLTTNHQWAVPAAADERRFAVFRVSSHRRGDRAYFARLDGFIKNHLGEILHWLLNYDLNPGVELEEGEEGWHPADHVPRTSALAEQKLQSMHFNEDPVASYLHYELDREEPFKLSLREESMMDCHARVEVHDTFYEVPKEWLVERANRHLHKRNRHGEISMRKLTQTLQKIVPDNLVYRKNRNAPRAYRLPLRDEFRAALADYLETSVEDIFEVDD